MTSRRESIAAAKDSRQRREEWEQRFRKGNDAYFAWLSSIFEGIPSSDIDHAALLEIEDPPGLDDLPDERCRMIGTMCHRSGMDLSDIPDDRVGRGLNYVFNQAFSDMAFDLVDQNVEPELRHEAIASIAILYRDCLERRCTPILSHGSSELGAPLSNFVYMFWDNSPIGSFHPVGGVRDDGPIILNVLARTLDSPSIACVESGLHGLNHMVWYLPEAKGIIERFLERHDIPLPLREYAQAATLGYNQ
jgi:hypothetical protein